jgi:hypothetical protein
MGSSGAGLNLAQLDQRYALLVNDTVQPSELPLIPTTTIRPTTGAPSPLASDQAGDFALDVAGFVLYGPFTGSGVSGSWGGGQPINPALLPAGGSRESIARMAVNGTNTLVSGQLMLVGIQLVPGDVITNLHFCSGSALTMGTNLDGHIWAALYDPNLNLLSQSPDGGGSATWAASSWKKFVLNAAQTITTGGLYYAGIMVNDGTGGTPAMPSVRGMTAAGALTLAGTANMPAALKSICGNNGSGLTTTAPAGPLTLGGSSTVNYVATS